jgi:DNA helicase HerA-like ATPase
VLDKSAQLLFRCVVRVVVSGPSRAQAHWRLDAVTGAFAAYEGRVGLRRRRVRGVRRRRVEERGLGSRAFLLSTGELAALAHLPNEPTIPGLVRASAREVPPPPGLSGDGKPLGLSAGKRVYLSVADARQHLWILGPTGTGKSTLIAQLVLADLAAHRGAVVIDPKGDLVEDVLARVPAGREDDIELFDPSDPHPLTMNMLDHPDRDRGDIPPGVPERLGSADRRHTQGHVAHAHEQRQGRDDLRDSPAAHRPVLASRADRADR